MPADSTAALSPGTPGDMLLFFSSSGPDMYLTVKADSPLTTASRASTANTTALAIILITGRADAVYIVM
jgi:hypothetical protein